MGSGGSGAVGFERVSGGRKDASKRNGTKGREIKLEEPGGKGGRQKRRDEPVVAEEFLVGIGPVGGKEKRQVSFDSSERRGKR